jgi:hypothetical protein
MTLKIYALLVFCPVLVSESMDMHGQDICIEFFSFIHRNFLALGFLGHRWYLKSYILRIFLSDPLAYWFQ